MYRIIRFRKGRPSQRVRHLTHLTLEEARRICQRDDSKGRTWFYGFTKMEVQDG
jgi:hypothetical protein